jgi:RNA polymerase sigma-70 factor (ECF subfamily)
MAGNVNNEPEKLRPAKPGPQSQEDAVLTSSAYLRAVPDPPPESSGTAIAQMSDLERLFNEHHDRVYRAAYRVTGSSVDAEDVLQTVFLRLARKRETPDLSPSPAAYLTRAAINASLDIIRSRGIASAVPLDEVEPTLLSQPHDPETKHADWEMRRLIRRAVAKLGQNAAEMFVLRYFEGYENKEIAQMLGTSSLVVGVTLHRARTRLRKEIGNFLEAGL